MGNETSYFTYGGLTVSLDKLRSVQITRINPAGGPPYSDEAKLNYEDGNSFYVLVDFAEELQKHLTPQEGDNQKSGEVTDKERIEKARVWYQCAVEVKAVEENRMKEDKFLPESQTTACYKTIDSCVDRMKVIRALFPEIE